MRLLHTLSSHCAKAATPATTSDLDDDAHHTGKIYHALAQHHINGAAAEDGDIQLGATLTAATIRLHTTKGNRV